MISASVAVNLIKVRQVVGTEQVRTDATYPAGFMDVIEIEKTDERFRLVYDTKGRFVVHRISREEATYKLAKVPLLFFFRFYSLCLWVSMSPYGDVGLTLRRGLQPRFM